MLFSEMSAKDVVLAVDLDDTLVRTDTLYENFWAACAGRWLTPVVAAGALVHGPVALKQRLASMARLDVAGLPYNEPLLAHLKAWKARGGRVVLVTAALQQVADAVSDHLGLFDEVFGSGEGLNLKGRHKAEFLDARYGVGGYIYVGDSEADLAVWKNAERAVTVTGKSRVRRRVDAMDVQGVHLDVAGPSLSQYVKCLRPHQWLKNMLVFVPLLAGHRFTFDALGQALLAFAAFSLVASSVYIFNDLLDLAADRAHPRKRRRPFASGAVPVRHGTFMAPVLGIAGLGLAALGGLQLLLVLGGYYVLSFAYSLRLKRLVAVDIAVLALLYTLRVLAGGVATGITPSVWLLAFSAFFFFMLAGIKRQAELVDALGRGALEANGRGYRTDDLAVLRSVSVSSGMISVLVLGLYADSDEVGRLYSMPGVFWAIGLVLMFWIARIAILTQRGEMHDDPLVFATRDATSHVCLALAVVLLVAGAAL